MKWIRVNKREKCPVCQHDSWCSISGDGEVVLCMRTESNRPFHFKDQTTGWLHNTNGEIKPRPVRVERPEPSLNVGATLKSWARWSRRIDKLAVDLGVSVNSLKELGCVHAPYHDTYAFPMMDGRGNMVGIRLRKLNGEKWAERGSHQGIFVPQIEPSQLAFVCEGPTDTASALTLNYYAVGRPSCSGGMGDIRTLFKRYGVRRAVVIADNDDPGLRGATMLCDQLPIPTCIMIVPAKDMREFVKCGGTRDDLDAVISQLVWRQPK